MELGQVSGHCEENIGSSPKTHGENPAEADVDDDGRPSRQGTVWTASSHVITAVIGSGVLALSWSLAQLGWIAGLLVLLTFAFVTYFTAVLLADSYRYIHPITGLSMRNYNYMQAVRTHLGKSKHSLRQRGGNFKLIFLDFLASFEGRYLGEPLSGVEKIRRQKLHTGGLDG